MVLRTQDFATGVNKAQRVEAACAVNPPKDEEEMQGKTAKVQLMSGFQREQSIGRYTQDNGLFSAGGYVSVEEKHACIRKAFQQSHSVAP